ncbi:hypothetical protein Goarm_000906 [Gossypium armourianum]|uniref:Uncharacterized protein n=1 Tax=Gossypium armourianum TaxID=34283 RepID=A0A7J9KBM0_9ROSI|nr:hypothetical protein [Gossypium armourianum]
MGLKKGPPKFHKKSENGSTHLKL